MNAGLEPDDAVITPMGRVAMVCRALPDDRFEVRYLDEPVLSDALVTLHRRLLVKIQPGREKPRPVRVAAERRCACHALDTSR